MITEYDLTPTTPLKKLIQASDQEQTSCLFFYLSEWNVSSLIYQLCELRAHGKGFLIKLRDIKVETIDEAFDVARVLYDWDQLSLSNLLVLLSTFHGFSRIKELKQEAILEQKSLKQWQAAIGGPLLEAPNLPWRKFLRKVNKENYSWGEAVLTILDTTQDQPLIQNMTDGFLSQKKKAVCLFPKKFQKLKTV